MDSSTLIAALAGAAHPASGGNDVGAAWLTALSSLGLLVVAILGWCTRQLWRIFNRTTRFFDDYFGEAARPGISERPGVMSRLAAVETAAANAAAAAAKVLAETQPNGGHSLRDVVHRIADEQAAMRKRMEQIEQRRQERDGHA